MIRLNKNGAFYLSGDFRRAAPHSPEEGKKRTIARRILNAHNTSGDEKNLRIRFDSLTSHDITYVGIIQTARASGLTAFPLPYVLTNCHNSLCAVGGTINQDDHRFALTAAEKYGGVYVPAYMAVIHSYNREMMAGCGKMILGSDSHTRYGALGTMGVGEGGGELVKQLLGRTWDVVSPEIVGVRLTGSPKHGVGPQDVAIALVTAVFGNGFVKNRVLEFIGSGVHALSVEYRNGIDVMTTETACLTSIWETDDRVRDYLSLHGRPDDYAPLAPLEGAYYDRTIDIDLGKIRPMIALPFHPGNGMTISDFKENMRDVLAQIDSDRRRRFPFVALPPLADKITPLGFRVDQGVVAGCSGGTYDNIALCANILSGENVGKGEFSLNIYPGSMPVNLALIKSGAAEKLLKSGAVMRECFCGPCFGAGDTPANGEFSIRHTTRNFPNREGSKPGEGQLSYVALMDARSIAATAKNGGILTAADETDYEEVFPPNAFDKSVYKSRVLNALGRARPQTPLAMGPNIRDWPEMPVFKEDLLVEIVSSLDDEVTTTDELIPSGETSSYRSNPLRLAEFTLSRRDPGYVKRAKRVKNKDALAAAGEFHFPVPVFPERLTLSSAVAAVRPGDGSAREQAASCQRALGGGANFAKEYATKRYQSNLINWGIFPFLTDERFSVGDAVFVPNLRLAVESGNTDAIPAYVSGKSPRAVTLKLPEMTNEERDILLSGCLINHYRNNK